MEGQITRRGFLAGTAAAALAPYVPLQRAVPPPLREKPLVEVTDWVLEQHATFDEWDDGGPWPHRAVTGYSWDVRSTLVVHQDAYQRVMERLRAAFGEVGTVRLAREESFGKLNFTGQAVLWGTREEFEPPVDQTTGAKLWDCKTIHLDFRGLDAATQTLDAVAPLPATPHQLWLLEEVARAERREGLRRALREGD